MPALSETFKQAARNVIAQDARVAQEGAAGDPFTPYMNGALGVVAKRNERHSLAVQDRIAEAHQKIAYARERAAGQVEEAPKAQAEIAPEFVADEDDDVDLYDDERSTEEVLAELGLEPPASLELSGEESLEEATKAADDQLERLIAATGWQDE